MILLFRGMRVCVVIRAAYRGHREVCIASCDVIRVYPPRPSGYYMLLGPSVQQVLPA